MKFLLGERLFNIFSATWVIPYPRNDQENYINEPSWKGVNLAEKVTNFDMVSNDLHI